MCLGSAIAKQSFLIPPLYFTLGVFISVNYFFRIIRIYQKYFVYLYCWFGYQHKHSIILKPLKENGKVTKHNITNSLQH